jgi:hypothetical protein
MNNSHWAEDPELVDRYVLNQMDTAEASLLDEHLRGCAQCREIVARERELVAGIRRAGRDAVKSRLSVALDRRKRQKYMWYRVAGVAAALILLITVGIDNKWFVGERTAVETKTTVDKMEQAAAPSPSEAVQQKAPEQGNPRMDASGRLKSERRRSESRLAANAGQSTGAATGGLAETQPRILNAPLLADAVRDEERQGKKDPAAPLAASPIVGETWLEGTVIPSDNDNRPAPATVSANALNERAALRKGKEENLVAGKAMRMESKQTPVENFILNQRPASEMPHFQQLQHHQSNSVQTLLQKMPAGTQLTVYLDSLLTKQELDQAQIQTIGPDSIIVHLGNRRVGYKLPPVWTGQNARPLK